MRPCLLFNFANIFIFIILGLAMTFVIITVSKALAPKVPYNPAKFTTYECGERPVGSAHILFNFRFYAVAVAFLIFDIELALVFPCASVFKKWVAAEMGLFALIEIGGFMGILFLGLIYMWHRGDLKWIKEIPREREEGILLKEERPIVSPSEPPLKEINDDQHL